jgi:PAS domain S-box-containing protein
MTPRATEKSAEQDIESLGRAVLFSNADAIVTADKDGIIRFWNPAAARIFGFTSAQAVGQSLDIIIPERLRKRHWDGYARVMAGAKSRYGDGDLLAVPAIKADGAQISIEFTIIPLQDAGGALNGFAAIMRDVTARFEQMRALKRKLADAAKAT